MKILDRKAFLKVPVGTLFVKVRAVDVGPLQTFRGRAGPNDFIYRDMIEVDSESSDEFATIMIDACEAKTRDEIPLDWHLDMSRDGLYDDDQMFGVLTAEEAAQLERMLRNPTPEKGQASAWWTQTSEAIEAAAAKQGIFVPDALLDVIRVALEGEDS